MLRIALQAFGRRSAAWFAGRDWQRRLPRLPDGGGRLNAYSILQSELSDAGAKRHAVSVTGIGQHYPDGNPLLFSLPNLLPSDLGLGLKRSLFGNTGLLAALGILTPHLRADTTAKQSVD